MLGIRNAFLPSLALWALIIWCGFLLAGCAGDDGMGDLWKGVKHVREQRR